MYSFLVSEASEYIYNSTLQTAAFRSLLWTYAKIAATNYHNRPHMIATPVNSNGTTADKDAILRAPLQAVVVAVPSALRMWLLPASQADLSKDLNVLQYHTNKC